MHNLKAILLFKTMFTKRTYSLLKFAFTEIYSTFKQTWCSRGCSTNTFIINSLIKLVKISFRMFQTLSILKAEELGSWNIERMFTHHQVSHVTCQVSRVTSQVSLFFTTFLS